MSENRASNKANYKSDWETPFDHFIQIAKAFPFYLDVCASSKNSKCIAYITEQEDAIVTPWNVPKGGHWFCNPPYGKGIERFIHKALHEMNVGNPGIMLLPPNIETEWFRQGITENGIRVLFYPQRIQFIDPEKRKPVPGKKRSGNNKGSILAAFTLQEVLPKVCGQPWWQTVEGNKHG